MFLITGSQGFIGSHLMNYIPGALGLDKKDRGIKQKFILCNLLDKDSLFWTIHYNKIEVVYHMAAVPSVPDSFKDPMTTYINNVSATINLIDVCKKCNVKKLIFASSSSVFGNSPYGHSKKVIEDILPHTGIDYTILRFFNVFGDGQRENIVKIMIDKISANEPVTIYGDGLTTRDFTHVSNVMRANVKATDRKYNKMTLDVGTGKPHSLLELYRSLKLKINPAHDKLVFAEPRIGDIRYSRAETFLEENEITHFEEGLDLCAWG